MKERIIEEIGGYYFMGNELRDAVSELLYAVACGEPRKEFAADPKRVISLVNNLCVAARLWDGLCREVCPENMDDCYEEKAA